MKKVALLLTVLAIGSAAGASVTAEWTQSTSGSYDIYTLGVTGNTEGAPIVSFDIKVQGTGFVNITGMVWYLSALPDNTSFLFGAGEVTSPSETQEISTTVLAAAATGGSSDFGMTPDLLQIVVPTGTISNPLTELTVSSTDPQIATPLVQVTGSGTPVTLDIVPEPATMSLLGVGALALLRRRRK